MLDRNGNGSIDNGTELFGDATPLLDADGNVIGKAADGFEALAAQDTNGDGTVNSQDANFTNLRVWQDLNQDGLSQANELKTLAELGIASLNVASVKHNQLLANGNQIADTGTYTKTDGSTGTAGVTAGMADINLAVDTFRRTFTDVIPVTAQTVKRGQVYLLKLRWTMARLPRFIIPGQPQHNYHTSSHNDARHSNSSMVDNWLIMLRLILLTK